MNCLNAADCVLAALNLSTKMSTASPNKPELETVASRRKTFSFSLISVIFSNRWCSATTKPAILRLTTRAVCLAAQRAKSVSLKDGHCVASRTCLSRCHLGLTDQSGGGPTKRGRNSVRGAQRACPRSPGLQRTHAPQNQRGW